MVSIQNDLDNLDNFKPPISKDKAKLVYMYIENEKFKTMEGIMRQQTHGEGADTTITLLVEHSKIEDRVQEKYGIEADEFQK